MNTTIYLKRIGLDDLEIEPTLENLKLLQRQHLMNVPFENLDIHWKTPIVLNNHSFYQKIVKQKRGGFCYELNGLFFKLLNEIGYKCKIISARVSVGNGKFGEEYDHLAILTKIRGEEYLTDVGFGDFITEPLKFVLDIEQVDRNGTYLICKFDNNYFEVLKKAENDWQSEYLFNDIERDLTEFAGMCEFHQSTKSHFSKGKVCSILTKYGRKTLTDKKFITTVDDKKAETNIRSEQEFTDILEKEFNIRK